MASHSRISARAAIATTGAVVLAIAAGILVGVAPYLALLGLITVGFVACVWARPILAAYLLIGLTPLVAGIDRGHIIPVLRPNEALALFLGGTLALRAIVRYRSGQQSRLRLDSIEVAMLLMALSASVVPIMWMAVRERPLTHDDFLYALVLWKYLGVYVIIRASVTTATHVRRCLWILLASAAVVAVIAILQSLGLFGVPRMLATYYAPFGSSGALDNGRGSSTLALPAATADLMICSVAIAAGFLSRYRRPKSALIILAGLYVLAALSAGEFSSALGLLIGILCIAVVTGRTRLLPGLVPLGLMASIVLRPVIERRLQGFDSATGLPVSWTTRFSNLSDFFWPKLFSDWNFLFGVQPAARVPVASQATGYVWIESGYTWLLWGGGIPLLASFFFFIQAALRRAWRAAHGNSDATAVAGIALFVMIVVLSVLMVFDPHLTYRGTADALFALLALARPRHGNAVDLPERGAPPTSQVAAAGDEGRPVSPLNGEPWASGAVVAHHGRVRTIP